MPGGPDSVCSRPVDHETILGSGADILAEDILATAVTLQPDLEARIRSWGLDPTQSRTVDFDGAEAQLYRIFNPDADYHSPALLLVRGAQTVRLEYLGVDSPLVWENTGDIAIFRTTSGEVGVHSTAGEHLSHAVSSHLNARIGVSVWGDEIEIRCVSHGQPLLEISITRDPRGLLAYNHGE